MTPKRYLLNKKSLAIALLFLVPGSQCLSIATYIGLDHIAMVVLAEHTKEHWGEVCTWTTLFPTRAQPKHPQLIGCETPFEKIKPGLIATNTIKPGLLNGKQVLTLAEVCSFLINWPMFG